MSSWIFHPLSLFDMHRFLAFVRKEFYHILRDSRTLLILFGLPFVMVLLFGFALTNEIKDARIAVLDEDLSVQSRQLTDRLLSSGYFRLARILQHDGQIAEAFRRGEINMAVVIPSGFGHAWAHEQHSAIQLIADASEQNTAISLVESATGIIQAYTAAQTTGIRIQVEPRMVFNPELKGSFVFVPGVMAMVLLLVSALMTSVTIAREKETGTMEVLLISPLSQIQILLGKVVPYLILSFLNGCLIIALGVYVLGLPLAGSLALLLAEMLLFIFLALSLGLLISTIAPNQLVAMFASLLILLMPTIFLSGFMFPVESMPAFLQVASRLIPASYFITIVKGIMIKGVGLSVLWPETLVLVVYAAVLLLISFYKLKPRLEI